jgi:hypothetical protein
MRTLLVLVVALATAGPVTAQQEVLLRMKPPQGQVTHYLMGVETYMKGGPMAQMVTDSNAPFMRMTAWMTNTVTAAAGDEFTLNQVMDSVRIASPAMPQMEQMMGQMTDMMKGTATVSRMTSRGRMMAVQVILPPAFKSMMGAQGGAMDMGGGANSNNISSFVLLPERPVRVGASWRDSMTVSMDSAGAAGATASFAATFTLKRMEGRVAVIGVDGTFRLAGGPMPGGASFALTGETKLDVDAGRATAMTVEMNGSAPTPMGEMPMKLKTTMTQQ